MCWRCPVRVTVSMKSIARIASAWDRMKAAHVMVARCGAGSMPSVLRISHTVEGAIVMPRRASSPWMRRVKEGFSVVRRRTRRRIEATVRAAPPPTVPARPGVAALHQVAMPPQHRVRTDQQPEPAHCPRASGTSSAARNALSSGRSRGR